MDRKQITEAIASKRKAVVWDDELKGFGVRIYPSGAASWIIKKRLGAGGRGAKNVWHVLGPYAGLPYKDAKKKAQAKLASLSDGVDPSEERRKDRIKGIETHQSGKLQDVFDRYYQKHVEDGRYWDELKQRFERQIIPTIGASTTVANISKKELRVLLDNKEKETKAGARLTYAALSPFFKWCVQEDIISVNPMADLTAPDPSETRERVLTEAEIVLVWKAASTLDYPWGPFYKLLLLTAQRREEVAGLPWHELLLFNAQGAPAWIIPKERTKNGKEHLVHLSPLASQLVYDLYDKAKRTPHRKLASKFVFTTNDEAYISGFSKAKLLLNEKIKDMNDGEDIPEWRVHDLRRTAATGMAMLGTPLHIVERILNHISGTASAKVSGIDAALVRVYQRFEYAEERKRALVDWANHIESLMSRNMQMGLNIEKF